MLVVLVKLVQVERQEEQVELEEFSFILFPLEHSLLRKLCTAF